jgi:tetratricopeptide (TPR) repeat protein
MAEAILRYQLFFLNSEQRILNDYDRITQFYQFCLEKTVPTFPLDSPYFVGRQAEQQLVQTWVEQSSTANNVKIVAISGAAGVGKSALAIHLGHQFQTSFPEFQLYADLRNYGTQPCDLHHVLAGFLRALDIREEEIPFSITEQAALFRSLTAKKRGLILLDHVDSVEQILPLLPKESSSLVLVTSLQPLTSLEGAFLLDLPALSEQEALELFQNLTGLEPRSEITAAVKLCARSPLAIILLGRLLQQLQQQAQLPLSACLAQLLELHKRSQHLNFSHPEIRASFLLTYKYLTPMAAKLLRLSGLLTEITFSLKLTTVLLSCDQQVAESAIQQLLQLGLIQQSEMRYRMVHPLIRDLALKQLASEDSLAERRLARFRISQFYWETARWLNLSLNRTTRCQLVSVLGRTKSIASLEQQLQTLAFTWFAGERLNLLATVNWMYQTERWDMVLRLTDSLVDFLQMRGCWTELEQTQRSALEAARYLGDRTQEARSLNNLGNVALQQNNWERAAQCYEQSITLLRHLKDYGSEARTLINLGIWHALQNQPEAAISRWKTALAQLPLNVPEYKLLQKWIQQIEQPADAGEPLNKQSHGIFHAFGSALKRFLQE